jgi:hypothetical protein
VQNLAWVVGGDPIMSSCKWQDIWKREECSLNGFELAAVFRSNGCGTGFI